MSKLSNVGNLISLYLDEIEPGEGTDAPKFTIDASARYLVENGGRNWIPVIVKEIGEDRYQVIGNTFIYAVAEAAGLERVWCIIADDSPETAEITQVLAGEKTPKLNIAKASRDEIRAALQYLIKQPGSVLKSVDLAIATTRIDEAPRQYWKNLDPIIKLKCGITKGKKLEAIEQIFYVDPQPMPEPIVEPSVESKPVSSSIVNTGNLKSKSVAQLKELAKQRGMSGYSKMKKAELIKALS